MSRLLKTTGLICLGIVSAVALGQEKAKPAKKFEPSFSNYVEYGLSNNFDERDDTYEFGSYLLYAPTLAFHPRIRLTADAGASWPHFGARGSRSVDFFNTNVAIAGEIYKYEPWGSAIGGRFGLSLPTSTDALDQSLNVGTLYRLDFTHPIGPVQLRYSPRLVVNYHEFETRFSTGGNNIQFLVRHDFGISYSYQKFSIAGAYFVARASDYEGYTSDRFFAEHSVGYQFLDWLGAGLAVSNSGPVYDGEKRTYNFRAYRKESSTLTSSLQFSF